MTTVAGTPPAARRHYTALDGVRGLAVLLVMVLHFTIFTPANALEAVIASVTAAGWIGVDLFFVLSGFLITGILLDTHESPHRLRHFYVRRTLRIFPLYYAYLLVLFVLLPLFASSYAAEHTVNDRRPWFWLYLGNVLMARTGWEGLPGHTSHLWSLAVEEQFYLIWPLLVGVVSGHARVRLCVLTMAVAWAARAWCVYADQSVAAYVLTITRMDALAAGAVVAVVMREQGAEATRLLAGRLSLGGGVLLAVTLGWNALQGQFRPLEPLDPQTQLFAYSGVALAFAGLIARLVADEHVGVQTRVFRQNGLRLLGKYSYALYMIHVPLRNLLQSLLSRVGPLPTVWGSQLPAQLLVLAVGIATSLVLAMLSWNLFERHFLGWKDRLAPDL